MHSKGVKPRSKDPITGEDVDEVARIMINFHNEVENLSPRTKEVFANQTAVWTTDGWGHLNMIVPEKYGGEGDENLTRTDDFCIPDAGEDICCPKIG